MIVSAVIAPGGAPAVVLKRGLEGDYELVVSQALIEELADVLARPKLRSRIEPEEAGALRRRLEELALVAMDPGDAGPVTSADPDDDYLLALAHSQRAALVSGDRHLLDLADRAPVFAPVAFLNLLDAQGDP